MPKATPGTFRHDATVNSTYNCYCHMCGKKLGPGMVLWYAFAPDELFLHPDCAESLAKSILYDLGLTLVLDTQMLQIAPGTVVDADPQGEN